MRILLIDDSKVMRGVQRKCLAALGEVLEFCEAGDGAEALAIVRASAAMNRPFDLILVDWNMPNMDGLTFVKHLRSFDRTTPAVMCTTESERERVIASLQAGANNYVVKPFTPESLCERITQTLAKAKGLAAAA